MSYQDSEGKQRSIRGKEPVPDTALSQSLMTNDNITANDINIEQNNDDEPTAQQPTMTPMHSNTPQSSSINKDRSMIDTDLSFGTLDNDPLAIDTIVKEQYQPYKDPPSDELDEDEEEILTNNMIL